MEVIGLLMIEHRLTEKMLRLMQAQAARMQREKSMDEGFVASTIDFVRTYIDRAHHGKEEDILFKRLSGKPLRQEHALLMGELISEHEQARHLLKDLDDAFRRHAQGQPGAAGEAAYILGEIPSFYQKHIEKEDKDFFFPSLAYFSAEERGTMVEQSREYDRSVFQALYREMVLTWEDLLAAAGKVGAGT
jgi:hemerythrin-like domain-containing protein